MKGLLENKNCVVTSGAHGMGYAIARLFALQGGRVAICGRDPSGRESGEELNRIRPGCFFIPCDLGDMDRTAAFGDAVLEKMGHVDVLVNCVGVNKREYVDQIDLDTYDALQNVNLKSAIVLIKKFVPVMMRRGIRGSIVNISSIHSVAPTPVTGAYAATKGGMNALTRVLAAETGQYGIRVNALCCGWVATTYIQRDLKALEGDREGQYAYLDGMRDSAPCLSPARAEDIAGHALFLASDMSAYITGAVLMDDGGASLQTHACEFPEPEDARDMRRRYFDTILEGFGE